MAGTLYVGTSGWSYPPWKGGFYPERIRNADLLAWYATKLPSVEVNATFRSVPSRTTLAAWRDAVPASFRFALKAPMRITHLRRLNDASLDDVRAFLRATRALGARRGPVLFQCPPNFKADPARLAAFVRRLPRGLAAAFEFRHPSWAASRAFLEERGFAWCVADDEETPVRPQDAAIAGPGGPPFAYLRLRRATYSPAALRRWADVVRAALDAGRDVHCYFRHEDTGTGPRWAADLAARTARGRG